MYWYFCLSSQWGPRIRILAGSVILIRYHPVGVVFVQIAKCICPNINMYLYPGRSSILQKDRSTPPPGVEQRAPVAGTRPVRTVKWSSGQLMPVSCERSEMKSWFTHFEKFKVKWKCLKIKIENEKWNENASQTRPVRIVKWSSGQLMPSPFRLRNCGSIFCK